MTKLQLVEQIEAALPTPLTPQERQHLVFYPGKGVLEAIDGALRARGSKTSKPVMATSQNRGSLTDKAQELTNVLRPYLRDYPERKATSELANTTHGVLDKLREGL